MNLKFWSVTFWKDLGYGLGSSVYLVRRLVSIADISDARVIIELGAGFGQVTGQILAKKSPDTRLIVIENDHTRFLELSRKYGTLCEIHEMSAAQIHTLVEPGSVDIVISTLPLGSISSPGVDHILKAAQTVLVQSGRFIQYQYALQNLRDVKSYFTLDSISFEPRNIWPAFIYRAYKK